MTVRTRMAPSPTGEYHVGHISTLLKNYAFARKHNGKFILRIEDTDQERKVEGAVQKILDVIRAYGLDWDEGPEKGGPYAPYVQSERLPLYREYAQNLLDTGAAYYCFCSKERLESLREEQTANKQKPRYDRHCIHLSPADIQEKLAAGSEHVIRLKVPDNQPVIFNDLVRGEISIQSSEVDDQVLLKSDGFPTYHLAVVVDDYMMKITHVMRGEEWISSTPKHILLYQAFGWEPPVYAHIPVFLNPDGKGKMSKRKGTVSAQSFLDAGYLPEALLNFFMILGWTPKDQREILSLEEYIQEFDPKDISPKSVVFDLQKLAWINGIYIRQLPLEELIVRLQPFLPADFPQNKIQAIIPLISERLTKLSEVEELTDFFYRDISVDSAALLGKQTTEQVSLQLNKTIAVLEIIENWNVSSLETSIRTLQEAEDWKKRDYFMLLRIASTGKTATPPLFETMEVIGKDAVLTRLRLAHSHFA
ncbi:MAG: glutamyl-tRNA synthetase [Patescibacteria group bacterium]|nr:glutamyl-tRNA synthetase [Patescibacteria group bacterium]